MATRALLTCAGGLGQPSVIRHLAGLRELDGVVGLDRAHFGASRALLDWGSRHHGEDLPAIVQRCQREFGAVVWLPCCEEDAVALDSSRAIWASKRATMLALDGVLPIPRYVLEGLEKPDHGRGGRGQRRTDCVQEWLPGTDWSVDVVADHGVVLAAVPRERVKARGMSVIATVRPHPVLESLVATFVRTFGISGLWNMQFREDQHGQPRCYEVNPRVGGSVMMAVLAGVDLFRMEVRRQLGLSFLGAPRPTIMTIARHFVEVTCPPS